MTIDAFLSRGATLGFYLGEDKPRIRKVDGQSCFIVFPPAFPRFPFVSFYWIGKINRNNGERKLGESSSSKEWVSILFWVLVLVFVFIWANLFSRFARKKRPNENERPREPR